MNLSEAFEGENSSLRKAFDACVENNKSEGRKHHEDCVKDFCNPPHCSCPDTPHHEGGCDKEIYQLLANTFQNGNCWDYVDWMDANDVVIDGTYNLEELAIGIQTLLTNQKEQMKRVVEEQIEEYRRRITPDCAIELEDKIDACYEIITKLNEV